MIRAIVKNGLIEPTDPLPPSWRDGHEVVITDLPASEHENWFREMEEEASQMDPSDGDRLMAALAMVHAEDKELARSSP
jgi:hypothetical protein